MELASRARASSEKMSAWDPILGVSRPFVVKEIEEKRLPARKVGTRRRVMFGDLMNYKQRSDASRQQALDKIAALDEELGLS